MSGVRVDRWLWSIRLFSSRSEATDACRANHVRINGRIAKPASTVGVGDRVEARAHGRSRVLRRPLATTTAA
jgi:ribosome-associated heat shock protein Hsp15